MRVDFHVHSTASDGSCTPTQLVGQAVAERLNVLALTDHDNCDGLAELKEAAKAKGLAVVAGVELSIEPGEGFDKFHLLGLGIDPAHPRLRALLDWVLEGRNERNRRIIANFNRLGLDIRPEPHGEVLARPHFAKWLVDNGYARDITEAFERYLDRGSPDETRCYEERIRPSQEEAIAAIHAAGGVAIMAHPKYWRRYWRDTGPEYADAERGLAALKERGLDGVECLYQANTPEEDVEFSRIALSLGLLLSAGSDYHGVHKPTISLGMEVRDELIQPLLSRLQGS